ncbi:glycosyltransferase family 2 protein [Eupransor demetentiae]|uniref:GT2 family (WcaE) n=1 Tax=Eupransor demetentiae TaxID=3109584 RepID=A0ABP0EPC2_9LACO|nr:GT2 family (WcaE) [Lactobacillaceae bacterium LMG 33000]
MPKFSIITPLYNVADYVGTAIQSVLGQDFQDWEMILVDDGSTDDSLAYVQNIAEQDARIKVISQKNQGVAATRNRGIAAAQGDYLLFLDPDDSYKTTLLAKLNQAIEGAAKPLDLLVFDYESYRLEDGQRVFLEKSNYDHALTSSGDMCWNKAYRREFWLATGLCFPSQIANEDTAMIPVLVALAQTWQKLDLIGYEYRRERPGALTMHEQQAANQIHEQLLSWRLLRSNLLAHQDKMLAQRRTIAFHGAAGSGFLLLQKAYLLANREAIEAFTHDLNQHQLYRAFWRPFNRRYLLAAIFVKLSKIKFFQASVLWYLGHVKH